MNKQKKEAKIISRLSSEITSFYLENKTKNFQIKVDKNEEKNEYTIYTFGIVELSESEVEELKNNTNIHKDDEYMEYWELMGEGDSTDEIILIARICDSVYVNYEDGILEIILKKIV